MRWVAPAPRTTSSGCSLRRFRLQPRPHHVHVTQEDFEILFGKGKTMTYKSKLSQPGQFAANEMVNLIGPKGRIDNVRILGPARKQSQVEISRTEQFKTRRR